MRNQNYALGTRGTLNMLNKVVAKLARKPGEVTRGSGLATVLPKPVAKVVIIPLFPSCSRGKTV